MSGIRRGRLENWSLLVSVKHVRPFDRALVVGVPRTVWTAFLVDRMVVSLYQILDFILLPICGQI